MSNRRAHWTNPNFFTPTLIDAIDLLVSAKTVALIFVVFFRKQ